MISKFVDLVKYYKWDRLNLNSSVILKTFLLLWGLHEWECSVHVFLSDTSPCCRVTDTYSAVIGQTMIMFARHCTFGRYRWRMNLSISNMMLAEWHKHKAWLHLLKGSKLQWQRCNLFLNFQSEIPSSFQYHVNLSKKGYRSLIYRWRFPCLLHSVLITMCPCLLLESEHFNWPSGRMILLTVAILTW